MIRSAARSTIDCRNTLSSPLLSDSSRGMPSSHPVSGPECALDPLAERGLRRLERDVVHADADLQERGEHAPRRQRGFPDEVASVHSRRRLGRDAVGHVVDDLAPLDTDRRLREKPGHLVAEPQGATAWTGSDGRAGRAVADAVSDLEEIGEVRATREPQLEPDAGRSRC